MPTTSDKTKISIRLFDGDLFRLKKFYPQFPYNAVIRGIVKTHLDNLDKRLDRKTPKLPKAGED